MFVLSNESCSQNVTNKSFADQIKNVNETPDESTHKNLTLIFFDRISSSLYRDKSNAYSRSSNQEGRRNKGIEGRREWSRWLSQVKHLCVKRKSFLLQCNCVFTFDDQSSVRIFGLGTRCSNSKHKMSLVVINRHLFFSFFFSLSLSLSLSSPLSLLLSILSYAGWINGKIGLCDNQIRKTDALFDVFRDAQTT